MKSPIEILKERVLGKKGKGIETELTNLLYMVREFSCLGEIIGRDFEVRDEKEKVIYTIKQKPIAICQLNTLLKEFKLLKQMDKRIEEEKFGGKNKGRLKR